MDKGRIFGSRSEVKTLERRVGLVGMSPTYLVRLNEVAKDLRGGCRSALLEESWLSEVEARCRSKGRDHDVQVLKGERAVG